MAKYVVVADAVVVTTGVDSKGKPSTARLLRGEVLTAPETHEVVEALANAGSIIKATGPDHLEDLKHPRFRQTAKMAASAQGADDDPVQPVVADILPLDAPVPNTAPPKAPRKPRAKPEPSNEDGDL